MTHSGRISTRATGQIDDHDSPPQEVEAGDTDQDVAEGVHLEQVAVQTVKPEASETTCHMLQSSGSLA